MDITPAVAAGKQIIQSYGPAGFRIGGQVYKGPVLVLPEQVIAWSVGEFSAICAADFAPLLEGEPKIEVVLFGTGATGLLVPSQLKRDLKTQGLAMDGMDTGAACRTYNVMLSEERRVAAALLPG